MGLRDPQAAREYRVSRYKNNPERVKASSRNWKRNNREKNKETKRRWRAANLETARKKEQERTKRFYKLHPEKNRERVRKRKIRKWGAEGNHTLAQWKAVLLFTGYTCTYCSCSLTDKTATRDHVVPLSKGGTDWISNIVPACRSCNSKKGTKHV